MNMTKDRHYALRYRSNDGIHKKGDIQFVSSEALYIGQTPECLFRLPAHPHYADTCYAVIVEDCTCGAWRIIRQEPEARILVDGTQLELISELHDRCIITLDNTSVLFTIEKGEAPKVIYVQHRSQKLLWTAIVSIAALLFAVIFQPKEDEMDIYNIYASEINDIYKIEAHTLLVLNTQDDTLETIPLHPAEVGTGFLTDSGYLVTARHCIEFWLGYEDELRPSLGDIGSEPIQWAIKAEMSDSIRLVVKLTITDHKGKEYSCTSEQFTMDKSRDHVRERGNHDSDYLWRSIISRYGAHTAELGDAAVMKWQYGKGSIRLASPEQILKMSRDITLQSFGYPQDISKQKAMLTADNGTMYHAPNRTDEVFICRSAFDNGFSGAPVFVSDKEYARKSVVGIVSRLIGNHTLIVPVSQIHNLIKKNENNEQ